MAYSLATVSPNSWQLQRSYGLAPFSPLSCRPPAFAYCGVRRVGRTIRSSAVAGDADEGTRRPGHQSWLDADSSTNSYAGWSSADETPAGNKLTGYFAAGAAGVILAIGFAFASHSLSTKRGVRDQLLVPVTAEQEITLSSDGPNSAAGGHLGDQSQVTGSDAQDQKQNEEFDVHVQVSESKMNQTAALHVAPGKVVVPAVVDHVQGQALAALQALKVVEAGIEPGGLCSRREYARWLIASSAILARNPISKVFPAMFIENVTELAFDDVTPEDPDFPFIQGLAEAGLISSKLSSWDKSGSVDGGKPNNYVFSPDSPLSRQDLICWKIALEKRQLPEVNKKDLWEKSGFIDIDKINQEAWPALSADLSSGEQSIVALAFGYTRLFQPDKPVTKAQAAVALATGEAAELVMEELTRIEAESLADTAVAVHASLEAQVQDDLNASFEKQFQLEREKVIVAEGLAEEARLELQRIIAEREEEKYSLMRDQAALDSEREFLSKLRHEVEEQVQALSINRLEISFERDQMTRLRKEAEDEKQYLVQLRSEVDVEKKALSMAREWAEEEAKKARAHAKALEEARARWERLGVQVRVDEELDEDKILASTWQYSPKNWKQSGQSGLDNIIARAEDIRGKLWVVSNDLKGKVLVVIEKIIQAVGLVITSLQQRAAEMSEKAHELQREGLIVASKAVHDMQHTGVSTVAGVTSYVREGTKRFADECRGGAERISQKFKT